MTEPVISARGVRKAFGTTQALDGFEIEVAPGEVHGFLGPNGAGKTTMLRILLGLAQRDEGVVSVLGEDPWQDAVRLHKDIAYVPGDVELWPQLSGGETIDLILRMRKVDPVRRDELIQRFELDPAKKVRDYSKGNKQKIALIAAFAADVPLYVFDEPTDGLDPLMSQVYRECVAEAREAGGTVLLSSHIMSEVEAVADRITIIRSGRSVESGSLADLRHLRRMRVVATTQRPVTGLADHEHVHDITVEGTEMTCDVGPEGLPDVLAAVQAAGPVSLDCRPPSLEEIFLHHYGEDPRAAELVLPAPPEDGAGDDTTTPKPDTDRAAAPSAATGADQKVPS